MISSDVIVATSDLVGRTGGQEFEIGWDCPHLPEVQDDDDHNCPDIVWNCTVRWKGARLFRTAENPDAAALALALAILDKGACRCGESITVNDDDQGCRWRLMGNRWEPGCDAPSIDIKGKAGDLGAISDAYEQAHGRKPRNRAQRRRDERRQRKRGR